jgi:hypothetical protein
MAAFLSSVAFMRLTSSSATLSCRRLTSERMPLSFLLAASSLRFASASAARLGATTCSGPAGAEGFPQRGDAAQAQAGAHSRRPGERARTW